MSEQKTGLTIHPYVPRVLSRDWGVETFIAQTPQYLGKVLSMRSGAAGGLQYHRRKDETLHLLQGEAWVDSDDGTGALVRTKMTAGMSFHIPPGAVHRFTAITDCVILETSTPHYDDRVRMEAAYGEPEVGGLPTTPPTWGRGLWRACRQVSDTCQPGVSDPRTPD